MTKAKSPVRFLNKLRGRVGSIPIVIDQLFGIDTRSLALFRVGLATLLLIDLFSRARYITAFYTDQGVLPRSFLIENIQYTWSFSFHLASGSLFFQVLLFLCAAFAAVALLVGYKTRTATFLSWLLLTSLHMRNPEVLSAGDILLRLLLFWSLFLPLGLHWSIDRARATNEGDIPQRVISSATATVLIQAALVYLFTWLLKTGGPWRDGTAVWLALNWDQGTTFLGRALLGFPKLLTLATHGIFWFELVGPLLLFLPVFTAQVRLVLLPLFMLVHLTFATTMYLGTFPFVSMVSLVPFLPSRFWEVFRGTMGRGITIFYDGGCSFCNKMVLLIRTFFILPQTSILPAQEDPTAKGIMLQKNSWVVRDEAGENHTYTAAMKVLLRTSSVMSPFHYLLDFKPFMNFSDKVYKWIAAHRPSASQAMRWFRPQPLRWKLPLIGQITVGMLLLYVLVWNLADVLNFSAPLQQVARMSQLNQNWGMFAPYPRLDDGWYVIPGTLKNGEEVDVFRAVISGLGEELSWDKPKSVSTTFPSVYWTKYFENLLRQESEGRYLNFARYLCRTWNAAQPGDRQLTRFDIYFMLENTQRLTLPPEKIQLWWQKCS